MLNTVDVVDKLTRGLQQCELGSTVGYAIRFEDCTSKQTRIKCWSCHAGASCSALTACYHRHDGRCLVAGIAE